MVKIIFWGFVSFVCVLILDAARVAIRDSDLEFFFIIFGCAGFLALCFTIQAILETIQKINDKKKKSNRSHSV